MDTLLLTYGNDPIRPAGAPDAPCERRGIPGWFTFLAMVSAGGLAYVYADQRGIERAREAYDRGTRREPLRADDLL